VFIADHKGARNIVRVRNTLAEILVALELECAMNFYVTGHHIVVDKKYYHIYKCSVCKQLYLSTAELGDSSRCKRCSADYRKWFMKNSSKIYGFEDTAQKIAEAARTSANSPMPGGVPPQICEAQTSA